MIRLLSTPTGCCLCVADMLFAILFSTAACGPYPCLPGIDGIGIGFDAVKGTSFGVGRRVVRFNFTFGNTYTDPFGNRTVYGMPDHASVTTGSTQFMGHSVARSVSQYVSTQAEWAGVDTHFGPWFSASAETKETASQMGDSLHIVIESRSKLTLYAATLDPPMLLTPDLQFEAVIDSLPSTYDAAAYGRVVQYYGTHYVAVAEFGGLSRMRTVATQSYYSTTSDSELQRKPQFSGVSLEAVEAVGRRIRTRRRRGRTAPRAAPTLRGVIPRFVASPAPTSGRAGPSRWKRVRRFRPSTALRSSHRWSRMRGRLRTCARPSLITRWQIMRPGRLRTL